MEKHQKRSWPQCEGMVGEEALQKIKSQFPEGKIQLVHQGQATTRDFRLDRVFIHLDANNKVTGIPKTG